MQSRVHAQFPRSGTDTLIALDWVEDAARRIDRVNVAPDAGPVDAGVDVARSGDDETVIYLRRGFDVIGMDAWNGYDLMQSVGRIRSVLEPYEVGQIKVDAIGLGAGVADRLRELGYDVVDVNVGAASSDAEKWPNLRHELWWELRELFHTKQINGVVDETTMGQLTSVKYAFDSRHTYPLIEKKDDMKKRGLSSPDRAEALMLAFAETGMSGKLWV